MIERFLDAGHQVAWVTGDEVYGGNPKLRSALEERGLGYVLAVACPAEVTTSAGKFRADTLAAKVPKRAWQKLSAGAGAKDNRFYDWAVIDLAETGPGHRHLLIRRNRRTGELAYYRCHSTRPAPLTSNWPQGALGWCPWWSSRVCHVSWELGSLKPPGRRSGWTSCPWWSRRVGRAGDVSRAARLR